MQNDSMTGRKNENENNILESSLNNNSESIIS